MAQLGKACVVNYVTGFTPDLHPIPFTSTVSSSSTVYSSINWTHSLLADENGQNNGEAPSHLYKYYPVRLWKSPIKSSDVSSNLLLLFEEFFNHRHIKYYVEILNHHALKIRALKMDAGICIHYLFIAFDYDFRIYFNLTE